MSKETLNEQILREFFEDQIKEALDLEGASKKDLTKFAQSRVDKVLNHLMDKAKGAKEGDEILNKAKEYGLNQDYLQRKITKDEYKEEYKRRLSDLVNEKNAVITRWVKDGLPLLRKCVVGMGLRQSLDRFQKFKSGNSTTKTGTGDIKTDGGVVLTPQEKSEVLLLKDFLDKLGLSFLYRDFERQKTIQTRFGVDVQNKDINNTTDVDKLNINFGDLSESELVQFYTSRKAKINHWAQFVKNKDNEISGLLSQIESDERQRAQDSKEEDKNGPNMFYDKKIGGDVRKLTASMYEQQIAKRYLDRTYGMALDFGENNNMFKFGNAKIDNDTLVVNFQAAMRCPAWQQCIMKDACYAKVSEVNYDNTLNSNLKKGFIWEQTKTDDTLMSLMSSLIRACMINYQKAIQEYEKTLKPAKNNKTKQSQQLELDLNEGYSKFNTETSNKMCEMTFSDVLSEYGQDMIDLLSKNKNGTLIRLNENGDFIGQWLVDAWEALATDFKLVGINVAAYTCRALNYESVRNMILNISQANLVTNQNSEAFAHYFYAITHDEYETFGETYSNRDNDFRVQINEDGKITPCYRYLLDENGELCGYYYKCPCGRGKYTYQMIDANQIKPNQKILKVSRIPDAFKGAPKTIEYLGSYYQLVELKGEDSKVDCYRCRICYGRDEMGEGIRCENGEKPNKNLPVFVFVAVHGENQGVFSDDNTNRKILGRDISYWANACRNAMTKEAGSINEEVASNENIGANDDSVMKQIAQNMTDSVAEMMRGKITQINEVRDNFNKILKTL
jgi:hypothetical protein